MTQLTFNNTQLLFVGVPMDDKAWPLKLPVMGTYCLPDNDGLPMFLDDDKYIPLGTIQNSSGIVSTTIPDEVLEELVAFSFLLSNKEAQEYMPDMFFGMLEAEGLTLQEGEKYAVLKIK